MTASPLEKLGFLRREIEAARGSLRRAQTLNDKPKLSRAIHRVEMLQAILEDYEVMGVERL